MSFYVCCQKLLLIVVVVDTTTSVHLCCIVVIRPAEDSESNSRSDTNWRQEKFYKKRVRRVLLIWLMTGLLGDVKIRIYNHCTQCHLGVSNASWGVAASVRLFRCILCWRRKWNSAAWVILYNFYPGIQICFREQNRLKAIK